MGLNNFQRFVKQRLRGRSFGPEAYRLVYIHYTAGPHEDGTPRSGSYDYLTGEQLARAVKDFKEHGSFFADGFEWKNGEWKRYELQQL